MDKIHKQQKVAQRIVKYIIQQNAVSFDTAFYVNTPYLQAIQAFS